MKKFNMKINSLHLNLIFEIQNMKELQIIIAFDLGKILSPEKVQSEG